MPNNNDTRIVEMQFDAKNFDKGIKKSSKNLEDFKKQLNFEDAAKQMTDVSERVSKLDGVFGGISKDVHKLKQEFAGVGSLGTKIAKDFKKAWESAFNSVQRFAKSLTFDQVKAGMEKFDSLQKSVMTIKAATGETEEEVYRVLNRLNQYTDQTSYNFSDMAANIGKFTSVGVPLAKAEKQMEGIANWAARSGGGIQEAQRAMYNLSQAMGVGALTMMDWKSIENAGMATKEFKNQLIQAGLAAGTLQKKGDKIYTGKQFGKQVEVTYQNLRETLSKKWADTETMQLAFEAYYYEDLYYEGKIASAIETSREQRDEIRSVLKSQDKDAKLEWEDWAKLEEEWKKDGKDVEEIRQKLLDIAEKQKKLTKETNDEGYEVYKTNQKNGKQIEVNTENLEELFKLGLVDESLITVALDLDADPLIEMTGKQLEAIKAALGENDVILKKDWVETMKDAGLATDEFKKASIEAGLALGTLEKKNGKIFTSKKLGKQIEVTMEGYEDSLKMKWLNSDVADKVAKFTDLGKAAYEAAQRCTTFKDVIGALKDMISTGWMNTYTNIFGELTESMGIFSAICNKVSEVFSKFIDLRNKVLQTWGENGGRNSLWGMIIGESEGLDGDTLFQGAYGLLDAMTDLGNAIYEAFFDFVGKFIREEDQDLFNEDRVGYGTKYLGLLLSDLSKKVTDFTTKIKDFLFATDPGETESRFDRIKHVVESIFSVITLVAQVASGIGLFVGNIASQLYPAFHAIELLIDYLLQLFTGNVVQGAKDNTIGNFFQRLAEYCKPLTAIINGIVVTVVKVIAVVVEFLQKTGLLSTIGKIFEFLVASIANKISEFLASGVLQTIVGYIGTLISKIPSLIGKLVELYQAISNSIRNNPKIQAFFSTLRNVFSGKNLRTILTDIAAWVRKIFKAIPALLSGNGMSGGGIKGFFKQILDGFLGLFSGKADTSVVADAIAEPIAAIGKDGTIEKAIDKAKPGIFNSLKTKISEIWTAITGFFESIANSEAVAKLKSFFAGSNFMEILQNVTKFAKWISLFQMGKGIGNLGKGLKSIGKGIKVFGKNLRNLNLSEMFSNMFNISNIIGSNNDDHSITKTFNLGELGPVILQIAAAIGILVFAAKEIIAMKPEDLEKAGIVLVAMIGALIGAGVLAKKFAGNGGSILSIAAALLVLILPLKIMVGMEWGAVLDGALKLGLIMAMLVAAAKITGNVKIKGLVGMAVAVNLLMLPLKALMKMQGFMKDGKFDTSSPLFQAFVALSALMLVMAGASAIAGLTGGAKGMLGLAAALTLMLIPIKVLGTMDVGQLKQAGIALGVLMVAITAMAVVTSLTRIEKLGGLVGAIAALSAVAWIVGKTTNWKQAAVGFGSIILMMGMMSLLFYMAGKLDVEQIQQLKNVIVAFSVMVGVIAAAIVVLTVWEIPEATILEFFGGLTLLLGVMAALLYLTKNTDEGQIQQLKNVMIAFTVAIGIIAGSLVALAVLDVDQTLLLEFFGGLVSVLLMMGVMIKLAEKTDAKAMGKLSLALGMFSLLVLATAGSLVLVSHYKIDWKTIAAFTGGITAMILGMGIALLLIGKTKLAENPKSMLIAVAAIVLGFAAILAAVGILIPFVLGKVGTALERLSAKLKLMSGLLKDFFDRMGTITEESVQHAMTVFDMLKDLVLKFVGFGDHTSDIQSVLTQLEDLGLGLDLFFLNEDRLPSPESSLSFKILNKFIEMSPSLSSISFGNLPSELLYLGVGLGLFNAATKDITSAEPVSLALLQGIFGQADNIEKFAKLPLTSFAGQMSTLGGAMSLYAQGAKEVTGIETDEEAPDISKALEILQTVTKALSGEDGLAKFEIPAGLPSKEDLGVFAGQLGAIGLAMGKFSEGAKGMDESGTQKAIDALILLAVIGGYLTPENLAVTSAFDSANIHAGEGTGTLGQFALDIGALGTALSEFSTLTSNATFDKGLGALNHFQELNEKLTSDKLAFTKVFNDADVHESVLTDFGEDIGHLGRALKSFAKNIVMDDGTQADFDHAIKALNFLSVMSARISHIRIGTSLKTLIEGEDYTFEQMALDLESLGGSLADMSTAMSAANGFNADDITAGLTVIEQMVRILNQLNLLKPDTTVTLNMGDYMMMLSSILQGLTDVELGERNAFFDENGEGMSFVGKIAEFAKQLSDAFAETGDINSVALEGFRNIATGLSTLMTIDSSSEFEYPGRMIALGIATGIQNGESEVVQAAIDIVKAAIDAANTTADIGSPSRVFEQLGAYMELGLVNGLYGEQKTVEGAGEDVVSNVISKVGLLMGAVSQALADNVDLQPTITPVLDLSNITGARAMLDGIFEGYALDLSGALNRAAAATSFSGPAEVVVQNPVDLTGIQNSIYTLQTDIQNLHSAISNIRIVLNTGVVAGGVTDDVDNNIGRKAFYNGRRN